MFSSAALGGIVFVAATGCGGSRGSAASSPTGGGTRDVPFDELNPTERKEYMQGVVVPTMTRVFEASPEPEHFGRVGCTTCHGKAANAGKFEMPSPDLPKFASYEDAAKEHPQMAKYMLEHVVPEMAKLLSEEPLDAKTGEGFGCFDCHMKPD